jgi:hypothetical protein
MTDQSVNAPIAAVNGIKEMVWYEGTDALYEGEAVCYNTDYGTAATRTPSRANRVERPLVNESNTAFAGVAVQNYAARSTGQFIEIYIPGSRGVNVALGVDTVIDTGILTFTAGASGSHRGRFYTGKYKGRGSAIPRQTVTAVVEGDMIGAVWTVDVTGLTITVTSTTGLAAGDTVILVGGELEEAADKYIIPGRYTIASLTATVITLTTSCVEGTPGAALLANGYAYTGNPVCQADLLTGDESGGVEWLSPPNVITAALAYMTEGVSYICGGHTLAGDCDVTFAQGTYPGQKKAFILEGDLTTSDFTLDLVSPGLSLDGSTALGEILTIDDDGDGVYLVFNGAKWHTEDLLVGATQGAT